MNIDTKTMVSITEANQNFSKVARLVDSHGSAIILKNNSPKYIILEFNEAEKLTFADDDALDLISERIMKRNSNVYKELAK